MIDGEVRSHPFHENSEYKFRMDSFLISFGGSGDKNTNFNTLKAPVHPVYRSLIYPLTKENHKVNVSSEASQRLNEDERKSKTDYVPKYTKYARNNEVIPLEYLVKHFHLSMTELSRTLDVCTAAIKRSCRLHGISKWPQRQIIKCLKTVDSLTIGLNSVSEAQQKKYKDKILNVKKEFLGMMRSPYKDATDVENLYNMLSQPIKNRLGMKKLQVSLKDTNIHNIFARNPGEESENQKIHSDQYFGRWTPEEHDAFLNGMQKHGRNWKKVAEVIRSRTPSQTRSHAQKYLLKARQYGRKSLDKKINANMSTSVCNDNRNAFSISYLLCN